MKTTSKKKAVLSPADNGVVDKSLAPGSQGSASTLGQDFSDILEANQTLDSNQVSNIKKSEL